MYIGSEDAELRKEVAASAMGACWGLREWTWHWKRSARTASSEAPAVGNATTSSAAPDTGNAVPSTAPSAGSAAGDCGQSSTSPKPGDDMTDDKKSSTVSQGTEETWVSAPEAFDKVTAPATCSAVSNAAPPTVSAAGACGLSSTSPKPGDYVTDDNKNSTISQGTEETRVSAPEAFNKVTVPATCSAASSAAPHTVSAAGACGKSLISDHAADNARTAASTTSKDTDCMTTAQEAVIEETAPATCSAATSTAPPTVSPAGACGRSLIWETHRYHVADDARISASTTSKGTEVPIATPGALNSVQSQKRKVKPRHWKWAHEAHLTIHMDAKGREFFPLNGYTAGPEFDNGLRRFSRPVIPVKPCGSPMYDVETSEDEASAAPADAGDSGSDMADTAPAAGSAAALSTATVASSNSFATVAARQVLGPALVDRLFRENELVDLGAGRGGLVLAENSDAAHRRKLGGFEYKTAWCSGVCGPIATTPCSRSVADVQNNSTKGENKGKDTAKDAKTSPATNENKKGGEEEKEEKHSVADVQNNSQKGKNIQGKNTAASENEKGREEEKEEKHSVADVQFNSPKERSGQRKNTAKDAKTSPADMDDLLTDKDALALWEEELEQWLAEARKDTENIRNGRTQHAAAG